jgi:SAM-dependent methyltransferase
MIQNRTEIPYVGSELECFAKATTWKRYLSRRLRPYIAQNVIEVGAGLGGSTEYLCDRMHARWLCLDPDAQHVSHLASRIAAGDLLPCCEARCGVLADLPPEESADTIIYVDVLEHIENDEDEMRVAAARLITGGHIVALSPAFNFLYSPFDEAIGHYRRYAPKDAGRLTVSSLTLQRIFFLDSLGFFASAINRLITRRSQPLIHQIQIWDKAIVPMSVLTDKIFGRLFGKSVVMIWQKI